MENIEIARVLRETADLLEIQAANPFRIRAYRNAVRTIEAQTVPMRKLVEQGANLTELSAIGKGMAENIEEIVQTGALGVLQELAEQIPEGLINLVKLPGLGSKKVRIQVNVIGMSLMILIVLNLHHSHIRMTGFFPALWI